MNERVGALDRQTIAREAVDDAFKSMAADEDYKRDVVQIAEQFAASDAEALEICERDMRKPYGAIRN